MENKKFQKLVLQKLDNMSTRLAALAVNQRSLIKKMDDYEKSRMEDINKCADGYHMVVTACTCLREELAEARGTIIDSTEYWNDTTYLKI